MLEMSNLVMNRIGPSNRLVRLECKVNAFPSCFKINVKNKPARFKHVLSWRSIY